MDSTKPTITLVCDIPLVCLSVAENLSKKWDTNKFYIWKACEASVLDAPPHLLIYFITENKEIEDAFKSYLKTTPYSQRPKILIVSFFDSMLLCKFCKDYDIEGVIDYKYYHRTIAEIAERILDGEIIREEGDDEITLLKTKKLSKQEMSFAKLMIEDKTKKQIMSLVKISERTFERRKKRIFEKCNVRTPIGLYKYFELRKRY